MHALQSWRRWLPAHAVAAVGFSSSTMAGGTPICRGARSLLGIGTLEVPQAVSLRLSLSCHLSPPRVSQGAQQRRGQCAPQTLSLSVPTAHTVLSAVKQSSASTGMAMEMHGRKQPTQIGGAWS